MPNINNFKYMDLKPRAFTIPWETPSGSQTPGNPYREVLVRDVFSAADQSCQRRVTTDNGVDGPWSGDMDPVEGRILRKLVGRSDSSEYALSLQFDTESGHPISQVISDEAGDFSSRVKYDESGNVHDVFEKRTWTDGTVEELSVNVNDDGTLSYEERVTPPVVSSPMGPMLGPVKAKAQGDKSVRFSRFR
jgi:hypothetical protein